MRRLSKTVETRIRDRALSALRTPVNRSASFRVDAEAWREIAGAIDLPAQARPELVKLFTRSRPD